MPLKVIGKNKHGEVIFRREDDDGTVVLLVCDEFDSLEEAAGPAISPEPDEPPPPREKKGDGGGGSFPMFLRAAADHTLTIDISRLPRGALMFSPTHLASSAIESLEAGHSYLDLDEQSAADFGFRGLAPTPDPDSSRRPEEMGSAG
jgi:hypothetical protein